MKRKMKKLALEKETLRTLENLGVVGGASIGPACTFCGDSCSCLNSGRNCPEETYQTIQPISRNCP